MDADLLSWYANYFTRFMEAEASDEWRVPRKCEGLVAAETGLEFCQRETLAALRGVTAVSLPSRK